MPQLVVGMTEEMIREAFKGCVEALNNTELTKLLPVTIRGVHVGVKQFRGGSRRNKRRVHRKTRRRITSRT